MPEIIISINRPHTDDIRVGLKTLEIRKTIPKSLPCKVYIYETKGKDGSGKVIGEFTLNRFLVIQSNMKAVSLLPILDRAKINLKTFFRYTKFDKGIRRDIFAWQIDDLIIYEVPKSLEEFGDRRAPQSWYYV
jgi:predicted transcriptional regulator